MTSNWAETIERLINEQQERLEQQIILQSKIYQQQLDREQTQYQHQHQQQQQQHQPKFKPVKPVKIIKAYNNQVPVKNNVVYKENATTAIVKYKPVAAVAEKQHVIRYKTTHQPIVENKLVKSNTLTLVKTVQRPVSSIITTEYTKPMIQVMKPIQLHATRVYKAVPIQLQTIQPIQLTHATEYLIASADNNNNNLSEYITSDTPIFINPSGAEHKTKSILVQTSTLPTKSLVIQKSVPTKSFIIQSSSSPMSIVFNATPTATAVQSPVYNIVEVDNRAEPKIYRSATAVNLVRSSTRNHLPVINYAPVLDSSTTCYVTTEQQPALPRAPQYNVYEPVEIRNVEQSDNDFETYIKENNNHVNHVKTIITNVNRNHYHTQRVITNENNYNHFLTNNIIRVNDIHRQKIENVKGETKTFNDFKETYTVEPAKCIKDDDTKNENAESSDSQDLTINSN